jgi:hypothetical protein
MLKLLYALLVFLCKEEEWVGGWGEMIVLKERTSATRTMEFIVHDVFPP